MKEYSFGFSARKLAFLRAFVAAQNGNKVNIKPLKRPQDLPQHGTLYVWGMETPPTVTTPSKIIRVEDGFLRSAGLGAALARPLSWVFDDLGLYIDATRPSRLETILNTIELNQCDKDTAQALRNRIISTGVSKYNLVASSKHDLPHDRKIVLVPGQVEDDASIRWGTDKICTNLDLLEAVRKAEPDAYLIYKPHPDVVAGLRQEGITESSTAAIADYIITEGDTISLLPHVDAVHVMTSLAGFEALIRGVPVTCWGQPFYAGWGLTTDQTTNPRRRRKLNIETLVYGALVAYPTYLSPSGAPSSALETIEVLANIRTTGTQFGLGPIGRAALRTVLKLKAILKR